MALDLREIELSNEQKHYIAEVAQQSGRPWREVLDEQLAIPPQVTNGVAQAWDDGYIEDYDEWRAYFQAWLSRRKSYNPNFDDSRESIYPDRT